MQTRLQRCALGFVAVLALQACGGGGDNSSTAPAAGAPPAPAPVPAPPPGTPPAIPDTTCGLANFDAEVLQLLNQRRAAGASCGTQGSFGPATALSVNTRLTTAAYGHSKDMADKNYFSHTSQDGRTLADRINATGYTWTMIGENIAAGQQSVQQVVDAWMGSDGHCANIMNPRFVEFGMACVRNASSQYGIYWTLDLGRP